MICDIVRYEIWKFNSTYVVYVYVYKLCLNTSIDVNDLDIIVPSVVTIQEDFWGFLLFTLLTQCFIYMQKSDKTPELETGAVKAILDLYDVMRHDVLSINMRFVEKAGLLFCSLFAFYKLLYLT